MPYRYKQGTYIPNRVDCDKKRFANITLGTYVLGHLTISMLTMLETDTHHSCPEVMIPKPLHTRPRTNALPPRV